MGYWIRGVNDYLGPFATRKQARDIRDALPEEMAESRWVERVPGEERPPSLQVLADTPVVVHFEGQTREVPQAQGEAMADTFKRAFPETKAKRPLEVSLDLGWLEDALTKQRALTDRLVDLSQQQLDILRETRP